jgi:hypothetical protein
MKLPQSRNENIVVQHLDKEVLIYDTRANKAYCLNATAAAVFNACGNNQAFNDLKGETNFTDDLIYLTLDGLKKNNLLEDDYISPLVGLSRRDVIRKIGFASLVALPVISLLVAPTATGAASDLSDCYF